jgi:hypothetical protein
VSIIDSLNQAWTSLLDFIGQVIIPDWGAMIGLFPVLLLLGVIGPFVTILMLAGVVYFIRRPRTSMRYAEGPRPAQIDDGGKPVFPPGLPYCLADGLVYPSGTTRCEHDEADLWVVCPMCGLGRLAAVGTCGNCGLVLKVKNRPVTIGPVAPSPPPGGAAAA